MSFPERPVTYNAAASQKDWQTTLICGSAPWQQTPLPAQREQKIPAWLFVAEDIRLMTRAPVELIIHREGDTYFVDCPELHVFAEGNSPQAARQCLDEQVIYFFERYTGLTDGQVTGLASELRSTYRRRFNLSQG
jgi:hypothetical protein